jgi:hypothetical protein
MGFAACEKEIDEIRLSGVYVLPTGDMTELHLAAFLTLSRKFVVDNIVKTGLAGEYRVYGREGQTAAVRVPRRKRRPVPARRGVHRVSRHLFGGEIGRKRAEAQTEAKDANLIKANTLR